MNHNESVTKSPRVSWRQNEKGACIVLDEFHVLTSIGVNNAEQMLLAIFKIRDDSHTNSPGPFKLIN